MLEAICEVTNKQFANDQQLLDYFKGELETQENQQLSLLDLVYFSQYESKIGFRYNLEAICGVEDRDKLW